MVFVLYAGKNFSAGDAMRKLAIGSLALLSLVVSVLVPAAPATSVGAEVTKTFTITKSDGSPYAGVLVALIESDPANNRDVLSTIATTGQNGEATITVPASAEYYAWVAQPGAGDVSHAPFYGENVSQGESESFSAELSEANFVVSLLKSDGQTPTVGSFVYLSEYQWYSTIIRTGAFGIDLSSLATGDHELNIEPNGMPGEFGVRFGLRVSGSAPIVRTLYSDTSFSTVVSPVSGAHQLRFGGSNFSGSLKASNGSTISNLGTTVFAEIFGATDEGLIDWQNYASARALVSSNGSFDLRLFDPVEGKYFVSFTSIGSLSIPTHLGSAFYIDSEGKYSMTESSFVDADTFRFESRVPATPNVRITAVNSDGSVEARVQIGIGPNNSGGAYWGGWTSPSGSGSFDLPDGSYRINLDPRDAGLGPAQFELTITEGIAEIQTLSGETVSPRQDGVYELVLLEPNLQIRGVSPTNSNQVLDSANIDIFRASGNGDTYVTSAFLQNGLASLNLPNGDYLLKVNPFVGPFAQKTYSLSVDGNTVTVTDADGEPATRDGAFFVLSAQSPNVRGVLLEPGSGNVPFSSGEFKSAQVELQRLDGSNWRYVDTAVVRDDGNFYAYVEQTGTYRAIARVSGFPGGVNTTFPQFTVSSLSTISNLGNLKLNAPTFQVRIRMPDSNQNLAQASVTISDSQGEEQWFDSGQDGLAGLSIEAAGEYDLRVRPSFQTPSTTASPKTYKLIATTKVGGGFNVSISSASSPSVAINPGPDGIYVLSVAKPNVTGKILDSSGTAFEGDNGAYAWIQAERYVAERDEWEWTNYDATASDDGSFGLSIDQNGRYRLKIEPYGLNNTSTTRTAEFDVTDQNRIGTARAFGDVRLNAPTAFLRVVRPSDDEETDFSFRAVEIRKDGKWLDWRDVDDNGVVTFTATGAGNYEFTAIPGTADGTASRKTFNGVVSGNSDSGFTLEITGVTPDQQSGEFILELGNPNVTGRLMSGNTPVSNTRNSWVWIQVQRYLAEDDRWEWTDNSTNVRLNGTFGLTVSETGTYRLRIETSGRSDVALTYSAEFEITAQNASSFTRNFGDIILSSPSLSGTVRDANDKVRPNAQVVAINSVTGQEMWEESVWTDNSGRWTMSLPEGEYNLVAKPGWRDATSGDSEEITGLSVDEDGRVSFPEGLSNPLTLVLGTPTWSGVVVSPSNPSGVIANASVCLYTTVGQRDAGSCSQTDGLGKWALSKPSGFTGFNSRSSLTIHENGVRQFAERRIVGKDAIEAILGVYSAGQTYSNITVSPALPNAEITIGATDDANTNVWVNVFRSGEWLGGATSDSTGKVRINIPEIARGFNIEVQPSSSSNYASTRARFSAADVTAGTSAGTFRASIELAVPNFKGTVNLPDNSAPIRNAWVELYNETTQQWLGGSGTNAVGQFSLNLDRGSVDQTFRITAHPSGASGSALYSKQSYTVTLTSGGVLTVLRGDNSVVALVAGEYKLNLQSPNVRGRVLLPGTSTTGVRDSWVVPVDVQQNRRELWEMGQNSRADGSFGLALANGSYQIFANVPGELSNYSRSALCSVTVASGNITTQDSSCVSGGELTLRLRDPNLTFRLMDGSTGVANAHVGVSVGNWYGWAQSSQNGTVSLLIDEAEVAASNPQAATGTVLPVHIDVNAPFGNTDVVSWRCKSGDATQPVCSGIGALTIGTPYLSTALNLGLIEFPEPNTSLIIRDSSGSPAENAWVGVYKEETGGWRSYIASGQTDSEGKAVFNIENTSGTFAVEVQPPWNQRGAQARKLYPGLLYSALVVGTDFRSAAPNLTINVKQSQTPFAPSRWANAWVEEVSSNAPYSTIRWVDGYGSDESGSIPMALDSNKTYRISANPGPGSKGARVSCIVSVNSAGSVSAIAGQCDTGSSITNGVMDLTLSPGNVFGKVNLFDAGRAVGAIVFAEAYESSNSNAAIPGLTREAIVDENGDYGLQLETGFTWKLKVFYVNPSTDGTQYSSLTSPYEILHTAVPAGASRLEKDFVLAEDSED